VALSARKLRATLRRCLSRVPEDGPMIRSEGQPELRAVTDAAAPVPRPSRRVHPGPPSNSRWSEETRQVTTTVGFTESGGRSRSQVPTTRAVPSSTECTRRLPAQASARLDEVDVHRGPASPQNATVPTLVSHSKYELPFAVVLRPRIRRISSSIGLGVVM
jgi:hypothetical protein